VIELSEHPAGVVLTVRAMPGASQAGIRGEQNGALKVAVTQIAEKGKANKALIVTLAKELGLKRSQIELLRGDTQREKRLLICEISAQELQQRISQALGQ
jgi:uncharacterized protein (TIGR00251 family)